MASYIVIRLVPDSPVDGATFGSYLDDLQIKIFPAEGSQTAAPLGSTQISLSSLSVSQLPWAPGTYVATVSKDLQDGTVQLGSSNYGTTLSLADGNGVMFGSVPVCASDSKAFASNTDVTKIPAGPGPAVSVSQNIQDFIGAGTGVTFYFAYGPASAAPSSPSITVTYTGPNPNFTFQLPTNAATNNSPTVQFPATYGVAVGMQVTAVAGGVPVNTTVTAVTSSTSVTLSNNVTLANGDKVTFAFSLNSGIMQSVEAMQGLPPGFYVPVPVSVATAVIEINPAPAANSYLDITVVATRNGISIPVQSDFYNVLVTNAALPSPDQYQSIGEQQTSLYVSLPAPPKANSISPTMSADGTPPPFDGPGGLLLAMKTALLNDSFFPAGTDLGTLTANQCKRMAYDIVWSQQNELPVPPDNLDDLYTNPPNPGGSTGSGSTSNLEQDRIKFEGSLSSFYATRNATAERLTKFVVAASAAIYCEQTSLNAAAALLVFPVDPATAFASEVENELLIQGLGTQGTSGIRFGVPAAFFYALGAGLDKGTTAFNRFQLATGDAIERLLQQFTAAQSGGYLAEPEGFFFDSTLTKITAFQAARRLVALKVSAASTTPAVAVAPGSPLANLVNDWLAKTDPAAGLNANPPLTYENEDFILWSQQIAAAQPQGYLFLDLYALTRGYVIPPSTLHTAVAAATGSILTFGGFGSGVGVGMPVFGTGIAPGTTVVKSEPAVRVTLSQATSAPVAAGDLFTFQGSAASVQAPADPTATPVEQLTFPATATTTTIAVGMAVSGTKISAGTTVAAVEQVTLVTLSAAVAAGGVPASGPISFGGAIVSTTVDTAAGKNLTFGGGTDGISAGMSAFGTNIVPGTIVSGVAGNVVTLSTAVAGDVPPQSQITFVTDANTLAYQIDKWLPTTTSAAPPPTVETLKQVTAMQWSDLFTYTGGQNWLPPFTQPVAPGAAPPASNVQQKPGYIALRIRSFIRAVHQFFTVSSVPTSAQLPAANAPPVFDLLPFDPIGLAVSFLPGTFTFGGTLASSDLATAVQNVFLGDAVSQAWLTQTMTAINELAAVTSVVTAPTIPAGFKLPNKVSFAFSVIEALYARGFRKAADITALLLVDFQQALIGTVAYDLANALYNQAATIAPSTGSAGEPDELIRPINPDGSLVDCIPPVCLAPTSPIAYLHEMLQLSPQSTCDNPWAAPTTDESTLGSAVSARRGPIGHLLATCANLEIPLPLIDLVNESLEYLGAAQPPPAAGDCGMIYDTSADKLAGLKLCAANRCGEDREHGCHEPEVIFTALAEYSTPAMPVAGANDAVEPLVYNNLKSDFSACCLPYSQALDVSRTYLRHFGTCRFEELRTFRKCITEFALDPVNPPTGFQSHLWRYPVRIETAIEYLGITPEEYLLLFQGTPFQSCAGGTGNPTLPPGQQTPGNQDTGDQRVSRGPASLGAVLDWFRSRFGSNENSGNTAVGSDGEPNLAQFLSLTCLSYCEFLQLWKVFYPQSGAKGPTTRDLSYYPDCEPCCLSDYGLALPQSDDRTQLLVQLLVFIRLWHKLRDVCGARYSFQELYDICSAFSMFAGGAINPEFIRQLCAFQMLRDHFGLPLLDQRDLTPGTAGADRTHLLALWVGPTARKWEWAVTRLLEGVEAHSRSRYGCSHPRGRAVAHMAHRLDALSRLAGFNPPTSASPSTDTWNSTPACTLRFAEVLAKICASQFHTDELLYLFNAELSHDCRDFFPAQEPDEALRFPLDVPDDDHEDSLWRLRKKLLEVAVGAEEACDWTWHRVVSVLREKFGYRSTGGAHPLLSIGQHFFPEVLEASGFSVSPAQRRYQVALTSSSVWNTPGSPFQYDPGSSQLSVQLPLTDEALAAKLAQMPALNAAEQAAVQDLYFAPRVELTSIAFMFADWQAAERHLIQECDERRRWEYFRRHVALADARRRVLAEHLAEHVWRRTDCRREGLEEVAALTLSQLWADENSGAPWESDSGVAPAVLWKQPPAGGAIAALLGLTGTGLLGEYSVAKDASARGDKGGGSDDSAYQLIWRDVRGPLEAFGRERDEINSPVPTVIPALGLPATTDPYVSSNNGYAFRTNDGRRLGGIEGFRARWSGVLLIENEGEYAFHAGAPTPEGERPDCDRVRHAQWRVTLKRGGKSWTILNHQWPGDTSHDRNMPHLRRGAHEIVVEYSQPAPDFSGPHHHPAHSGFEVKYAGPDSGDCLIALPRARLYRDFKDQTLGQGVAFLTGSHNAQAFLEGLYTSTLRDVRRTYQRAFKAVLFAGKLGLSAGRAEDDRPSELGYMLANPGRFAGYAYYRTAPNNFAQHLAGFDFNFLPLQDNYHAPAAAPPDRSAPSLRRTQAMFDWWERIFDYTLVRKAVHHECEGRLWWMFHEALSDPPAEATHLLRFIGAEHAHRQLDLRFYQDQASPIYAVSIADLQDERWLVRAWHAERWIRGVLQHFHAKGIVNARPDLWAALDPSAAVPASGVAQTGNSNLASFLNSSCLENGEPRRYGEVKKLNDGLRERGRNALIAYLCAMDRVPIPSPKGAFATTAADLTDLLLLDVETGICERTSRIEDAISAVQTFVHRSRLGREPLWKGGYEFARLWDRRFESYEIWKRCKLRELYRENWIEWLELDKARRVEAFRFLESSLRTATLTLAAPGGLDWWADDDRDLEHEPKLLQRGTPSQLTPLAAPPQSATREGLGTLGTPGYAGQPSWLAAVPQSQSSSTTPPSQPGTPTQPGGPTQPTNPNQPVGGAGSANGNQPAVVGTAVVAAATTGRALVRAAANGSSEPQTLPFWMESAMKLGTRFVRVAAAGVPQASLEFVPHRDNEHPESCCNPCHCEHSVLMDEYYFWLADTRFFDYTDQTDSQIGTDASFNGSFQFGFQDSYYDKYQQQSGEWNDEDQVAALLAKWQSSPAVRLYWCRSRNGEFGQPRRSEGCVPVTDAADLIFLGRAGDSLYFEISGGAAPQPVAPAFKPDTSPPGFRYDLPTDHAIALPEVIAPPSPATSSPYPGGLLSYPFFAYNEPGARLFPAAWFAPSVIVADTLRAHCRFELALKWYKRAFDPLQRDCSWMNCPDDTGRSTDGNPNGSPSQPAPANTVPRIAAKTDHGDTQAEGACCDSSEVSDEVCRQRAVTLDFCETLLDWGDSLLRCRRSPESFQKSLLLFDTAARIAGKHPRKVMMPEPASAASVATFVPAYAPLNPRLLDLYGRISDRRALVHSCESAQRLRNGRPVRDSRYRDDGRSREAWRAAAESCAVEEDCCCGPSPYRFVVLIQKAMELASKVRELEVSLLAAREKGDGEALASIRAVHEREMLALGLAIRQDQWRDSDWQVQVLQQTKDVHQTSLIYYNTLYDNGLVNDEIQNLTLATNAMQTRTSSNITAAIGEAMTIVPDFFVGAMSTFTQVPIGTKLAALFGTISKVMQTVADIQSATAAIDMTEAGWKRRSDEWFHQTQVLPIEIQQVELQILGAQRKRDQAMRELNNQQRMIENATEVEDFLRDKLTATDLYLFLQKETLALHRQMHELARCAAIEAQRACNFELGHTTKRFIAQDCADSPEDTLVAGQRLELALRRMEQAYRDENVREYELTKHFSLRLHFPLEFLKLKTTGSCEVELPEWMFDMNYPGQFMRRIRSMSLTIPCVTGPFTGVHCRATLLSSRTRIDPRLDVPVTNCCCERGGAEDGYETCPHDPRMVHSYGAREAIATSSGQNDSGLFELNFRDERYLPFEFQGAVSRWRIELPRETNWFPRESLADLHMHVNFTSREGGELLRRVAGAAAQRHLPGAGWCLFDIRHEFPDAWQVLKSTRASPEGRGKLQLQLERRMFPFIPGSEALAVTRMALLFHAREDDCGTSVDPECPCPHELRPACRDVEFTHGVRNGSRECGGDAIRVPCVAVEDWPELYCGEHNTHIGPIGAAGEGRQDLTFRFPDNTGELEYVYLLCRYERNCH